MAIQHFAVDGELQAQGLVAGFDSLEESTNYIAGKRQASVSINASACNENAYFYDGEDYGYPRFYNTVGQQRSYLPSTGWNDRVGSFITPGCPSTTILYEHAYFSGATCVLGPSSSIRFLSDYYISFPFIDWNNETSSVRVIGNFDYNGFNTNNATQNTVNKTVTLSAGQTLEVGTCTVPTSSGTGDTYLRLFDPKGAELPGNDDSCGFLSYIRYTARETGTYEIRAGCYAGGSCSGHVCGLCF